MLRYQGTPERAPQPGLGRSGMSFPPSLEPSWNLKAEWASVGLRGRRLKIHKGEKDCASLEEQREGWREDGGGHIRLEGWVSRAGSKSTGAPESILRTLDHPKGGGTFTGVWNDQMILLSGELCQVIKNSQEEVSVKVGNEIRRWFH